MGLADRLAVSPRDKRRTCVIGNIMEEVNSEDVEALENALSDPDWTNRDILRALNDEGYTPPIRHISEHRNGRHDTKFCFYPDHGLLKS